MNPPTTAPCCLLSSRREREARQRGRLRRRHAPAGAPGPSPPAHAHHTPPVGFPSSFLSSIEVLPLCSFFDNFLNPHTLSGTFSFLIPSAAAWNPNHVPFQSLQNHALQSQEPPSKVSLSRASREKATTSRGISVLPESFARSGKLTIDPSLRFTAVVHSACLSVLLRGPWRPPSSRCPRPEDARAPLRCPRRGATEPSS